MESHRWARLLALDDRLAVAQVALERARSLTVASHPSAARTYRYRALRSASAVSAEAEAMPPVFGNPNPRAEELLYVADRIIAEATQA